jgi:hypothetical protein
VNWNVKVLKEVVFFIVNAVLDSFSLKYKWINHDSDEKVSKVADIVNAIDLKMYLAK